jgi:DNA protecting protein DprA
MEWFDLWCASLLTSNLLRAQRVGESPLDALQRTHLERALPPDWRDEGFAQIRERVLREREAHENAVNRLRRSASVAVVATTDAPALARGTASPWVVVQGCPLNDAERRIAVVGTRRLAALPTPAAHLLEQIIGQASLRVVSGGALGVDTIAHRQALALGKPPTLVLAGGLAHAGPRRNSHDFARILAEGGRLVSSRPAHVEPARWEFSERNRLLASLAQATLLVRSPTESGARITCAWSRHFGRPVLVLPWAPHDVLWEGCASEIELGATVATDAIAIADAVNAPDRMWPESARPVASRQRAVASPVGTPGVRLSPPVDFPGSGVWAHPEIQRRLVGEPWTVDELCLVAPEVPVRLWLQSVVEAELMGWVAATPDQRWIWQKRAAPAECCPDPGSWSG